MSHLGPNDARCFTFEKLKGYHWPDHDTFVLGVYAGERFDGTDKLAMDVPPSVPRFYDAVDTPCSILFEGDRLTNNTVLSAAPTLTLFAVRPPQSVLQARRNARQHHGHTQAGSWLEGRKTKVQNIIDEHTVRRVPWDDAQEAAKLILQATPTYDG